MKYKQNTVEQPYALNTRPFLFLCALALLVGCSSSADSLGSSTANTGQGDNENVGGGNSGGESSGGEDTSVDAGPGPDSVPEDAPYYVIANEVYAADDSTSYVNILRTLDNPEIDIANAIEFPGGRATMAVNDGRLFVNPPNSQLIERYVLEEDGTLRLDGTLSFANYGVREMYIDEWGNTFISPTKAYLINSSEGEIVVWNPTTLEIEGTVDHGDVDLLREGWSVDWSPAAVRGDRMYITLGWADWTTFQWSDEVYLAVYNTQTDELIDLVQETRCPSLNNRPSRDEDGNLYFANWIWSVGPTLLSDGPVNCVLRVNAGEDTFDPDWQLSYPDVSGGRQGAMFSYLKDGTGLMSVFYDERVEITDTTVSNELLSTDNWRMWTVNTDGSAAALLEGLDWNSGAISTFHVDDRSFLFVPTADWGLVQVYEVTDGEAVHSFDVEGWSYQFARLK